MLRPAFIPARAYSTPSASVAEAMQIIAWDAVRAEPYSGVDAESGVPTVVARDPDRVELAVDNDGAILATFSEAMNPATITTSTFYLMVDGVRIASTVAYAGLVATLTPDASLVGATEITAVVTADAEDAGGTRMGANHAWSFTTASALPAPELNTTGPLADATGTPRHGIAWPPSPSL